MSSVGRRPARPRTAVLGLAFVLAGVVLVVGCTREPEGPPLPTGIEVAETLRAEGLPVESVGDGNLNVCTEIETVCVYLTYFRDARSNIKPGVYGYSGFDRQGYGGTVEVYPDREQARLRGVELQRKVDSTPTIEYAIFTADVVVLSLGTGLLTRIGPPYVGDDYRQALEKHFGPTTFTATRPARFRVPYSGATPTAPAPTPTG